MIVTKCYTMCVSVEDEIDIRQSMGRLYSIESKMMLCCFCGCAIDFSWWKRDTIS